MHGLEKGVDQINDNIQDSLRIFQDSVTIIGLHFDCSIKYMQISVEDLVRLFIAVFMVCKNKVNESEETIFSFLVFSNIYQPTMYYKKINILV